MPSAMRKITIAASSTGLPVGGRPSSGPVFVPCSRQRIVTRSPSATRSSIVNRRSGCAVCIVVTTYSPPAAPGGCPGSGSWSRKSGARTARIAAGSPAGISSSKTRRISALFAGLRSSRCPDGRRREQARVVAREGGEGRAARRPVSDSTVAVTRSAAPARSSPKSFTTSPASRGRRLVTARGVVGHVDERDVAAGGRRQLRRHPGVGDRLRAGEDVGAPVVARRDVRTAAAAAPTSRGSIIAIRALAGRRVEPAVGAELRRRTLDM